MYKHRFLQLIVLLAISLNVLCAQEESGIDPDILAFIHKKEIEYELYTVDAYKRKYHKSLNMEIQENMFNGITLKTLALLSKKTYTKKKDYYGEKHIILSKTIHSI
jgi:hypothetical protein